MENYFNSVPFGDFKNIYAERNFLFLVHEGIDVKDAKLLSWLLELEFKNERVMNVSRIDKSEKGVIHYQLMMQSANFITKTITQNYPK